MTAPYRDSCSRCAELEAKLASLTGTRIFPFQDESGGDSAFCVHCNEEIYGSDKNFCDSVEMTSMREVTEGFWWWKTSKTVEVTDNEGCPPIPHFHRSCDSCDAQWIEYTRSGGMR